METFSLFTSSDRQPKLIVGAKESEIVDQLGYKGKTCEEIENLYTNDLRTERKRRENFVLWFFLNRFLQRLVSLFQNNLVGQGPVEVVR